MHKYFQIMKLQKRKAHLSDLYACMVMEERFCAPKIEEGLPLKIKL